MKLFLSFFVTLLIICAISLYALSSDFASSLVPGWHTTMLPSYFFIWFILSINFMLPLFLFWILSRRDKQLEFFPFIVHIILSTIIIALLKFPTIFNNNNGYDINQSEFENIIRHIKIILTTFIMEQIIFGIYLIIVLKKAKSRKINN